MRALETGRVYLTAANTGITAVIGADGRLLARLPQYTKAGSTPWRRAAPA